MIRALPLALALLASGVAAAQPALCHRSPAAQTALSRLRDALAHGRFVSYEPTSLQVVDGRVQSATSASIRADLRVLRPRFDALVTYDAVHGAQGIPGIASALGFRALIIGVYDPTDATQVDAALAAAQAYPHLVVGVSLGNELLFAHRAGLPELEATIAAVRTRAPHLALSTTEPFHLYEDPGSAGLLARLDFLLVNVHPVFQPWFRSATEDTDAQFVVNVVHDLADRYCGPILVKETGEPTGPQSARFTPARQAGFYAELRRRFPSGPAAAFAYFSAFDAPWRARDAGPLPTSPEEGYWGLYDSERRPKRAALELPSLER
jgi:exo-beta-1,3-glucanase (GH17 family)